MNTAVVRRRLVRMGTSFRPILRNYPSNPPPSIRDFTPNSWLLTARARTPEFAHSSSPVSRSTGTRGAVGSPRRGFAGCRQPRSAHSRTSGIECLAAPVHVSAWSPFRSSPSASLQLREAKASPRGRPDVGAVEDGAVHRRRDGAADRAIEPVVVEAINAEFPLIDRPAATLRLHAVLAGEMLGEELVGGQAGDWRL